jgi:hypothetical protein
MFPFVEFMIRHKILLGRNPDAQMRWRGLHDGD